MTHVGDNSTEPSISPQGDAVFAICLLLSTTNRRPAWDKRVIQKATFSPTGVAQWIEGRQMG